MRTEQPTDTAIPVAPIGRTAHRGPRLRWVTAALVVVGVLGFAGVSCTPEQVAQSAISSSFSASQQDCAMRIAKRESNYNPNALSPDWMNIGLFQINHVHATWIRNTYGYEFKDLFDANKNARVAKGLSDAAKSYYGDQWQPWRPGGKVIKGGGCPA